MFRLPCVFYAIVLSIHVPIATAQEYDIVIIGGRVIDPETMLDAVRNVGVKDGTPHSQVHFFGTLGKGFTERLH